MPGLDVSDGLSSKVVAVTLFIEIPLHLIEGGIFPILVLFMISQTILPVPVEVLVRPILVDVVRMGYIKLPVIVLGIVDPVLSGTAIVTRHPLF